MSRIRLVLAAALVASGSLTSPGAAATPRADIVLGIEPVPAPLSAPVGMALHHAQRLAERHPDDLAHPWASHGAVYFAVVTEAGADVVRHATHDAGVPWHMTRVARSHRRLDAIRHELTTLGERDLPGVGSIVAVYVDAASNRVVSEAGEAPDALLASLARRYAGAVALRVVPGAGRASAQARGNDVSPFSGGARFFTPTGNSYCTTGFPWQMTSTTYSMMTAGHCVWDGGLVTTPSSEMGNVTSGTTENWAYSTTGSGGTQLLSGQSVYHGDLGRIDISSGRTTAARIYVGSSTSNTTSPVVGTWGRGALPGDLFCVGGALSGEICGWSVFETNVNVYAASEGGWARNVVRARKVSTPCTQGGDSGAPVYTSAANGVTAKGIHNGTQGTIPGYACTAYFTDIWHAWDAFGGFVQAPARSFGPTLSSSQILHPPNYLVSPDGRFVARMQLDGNFVLYKPGNVPVWSTRTNATANRGTIAEMQPDGNFVLYRPGHVAVWASNTAGRTGAYLTLQNDCNLVIYSGGIARWASNTAGCA